MINTEKFYITPCNNTIFITLAQLLVRIGVKNTYATFTPEVLKEYYKLNNVIKVYNNTLTFTSEYAISSDDKDISYSDITFVKNNQDFLKTVITEEEGDIFQKYFDVLGPENLFPPINTL